VADEVVIRARLLDEVSRPAAGAEQSLDRLGRSARRMGRDADDGAGATGRLRGGIFQLVTASTRGHGALGVLTGGLHAARGAAGAAVSTLGGVATTLGGVAVAAARAGVVIGGATAAATFGLLKLGSDANEAFSAFGATFGSATSTAEESLRELQDITGQATTEMQVAFTQFGSFAKGAGVADDQLVAFSSDLVGAAGDIASFNNADLPSVLAAIQSGLSGEAEPLRRFRIFMSDAALSAQAAKMGFGSVFGELSEGEKVIVRQAFIMANLGDQAGDLARTADQPANAFRYLTGRAREAASMLGGSLLPAVAELLGPARRLADDGLDRLADHLPTIADASARLGRRILDLAGHARDAYDAFGVARQVLIDYGADSDVFGRKARELGESLGLPAEGVAAAVSRAQESYRGLLGWWDEHGPAIAGAAGEVRDDVVDALAVAGSIGETAWAGLRTWWGVNGPAITVEAERLGGQIVEGFREKVTGLLDVAALFAAGDPEQAGVRLGETIRGALSNLGDLGGMLLEWVGSVDWIGYGIEAGKLAVPFLTGIAIGFINVDWSALLSGLADHWTEVVMAVLSIALAPAKLVGPIGRILSRIPFVGAFLERALLWVNELGGPIRDFMSGLWHNLARGFTEAMDLGGPGLLSRLGSFMLRIPAKIGEFFTLVAVRGYELAEQLGRAIATHGPVQVSRAMHAVGEALSSAGSALWGRMTTIGGDLVRKLWDGMKNLAGWLGERVGGLFGGIATTIGTAVSRFNPFDSTGDGPGMGFSAGTAPPLPAAAGYRAQTAAMATSGLPGQVTSGLRPGAITATGKPSYHGMGRAVDWSGPPNAMFAMAKWLIANYPHSREVIYSPLNAAQWNNGRAHYYGEPTRGDHFDHVHWALLHGGPVDAGLSYLVGEMRPELFVGQSGAAQVLAGLQVFTPPETGWLYPQVPDTRPAPTLSAPWVPPSPTAPATGGGGLAVLNESVTVSVDARGSGLDADRLRADIAAATSRAAEEVLARHRAEQRDHLERTTRHSRR